MTNAELIARLQELPPDLPVRVGSENEDSVVTGVHEASGVATIVWGPHLRVEWDRRGVPPIWGWSDVGGEHPEGV